MDMCKPWHVACVAMGMTWTCYNGYVIYRSVDEENNENGQREVSAVDMLPHVTTCH